MTCSATTVSDVLDGPPPYVLTGPIRIPLEQVEAFASSNGVVAHLEAKAADETNGTREEEYSREEEDEDEEGGDEEEEEEDSEDVRAYELSSSYRTV